MLFMGKSTISMAIFNSFLMLFVCLPEGIWIDRSKSWNSRRQWWWSRKWELDQKIMQMIGSYLLGCGVWFYPNGSHWSQGLFSKKTKKNYAAFRTNGPSSGENPWCLAFHFGFPRTNNLKTSSWTISGQNLCSVALPSQISTWFGVMPDRTTNIHLGMAGRSSTDHDWKTQVKGPRGPTRSQYPPVLSYVALETPPLIDERIPAKTLHFHGDVPIPTFYQRVSHKAISKQGTNRQAPKRCMWR